MGIFDYFTPEARRGNREWLDSQNAAISEALRYYLGPTGIPERLGLLAESTPTAGIERAGTESSRMFAPGLSGWDRMAAAGNMLSETAGAGAGLLGMPAAGRMADDLVEAAAPAMMRFGGDEFGGFRLYQGSPHNFSAERLVRMPDGSTQYVVGAPDRLPDVPAGAELLQDFPLGRQRMDKIGTGEGAQAYGYGLYGAEAEDVARGYRDRLSDKQSAVDAAVKRFGGVDEAINAMKKTIGQYESGYYTDPFGLELAQKRLAQLERQKSGGLNTGSMYEMQVNADPEAFLDWDKPLSEQPQVTQRLGYSTMSADAINEEAMRIFEAMPGGAWMKDPVAKARIDELQEMLDSTVPDQTGAEYYRGGGEGDVSNLLSQMGYGNPQEASAALREAGIPGIRYLDAGSRGNVDVNELRGTVSMWKTAVNKTPNDDYAWKMLEESEAALKQAESGGSRNYVIFDENLINIVRKYGIAGAAAMLGISQADVAQAMGQPPQGLLESGPQ